MGDSIYNAKRNTARQFLKDNKNSNFKPTENHKLSDIEKEIKKLRESPVVSTKLHNLEFHAGILRRGITNLANLESQIDKNFHPKSGTGTDYVAAQIIHDDPKDNTFEILGDIGKEVTGLIMKARDDADRKQKAEALEKVRRERLEAEEKARRVSSSSSLSSSSNDSLNSWTKKRRRVEFGELAREFLTPALIDELRWKRKEAATIVGLGYIIWDRLNPNKIKGGCTSFWDQRKKAYKTSMAFPEWKLTNVVSNKWDLERKLKHEFKEHNVRELDPSILNLPPPEPGCDQEEGGTELFYMPVGSAARAALFDWIGADHN